MTSAQKMGSTHFFLPLSPRSAQFSQGNHVCCQTGDKAAIMQQFLPAAQPDSVCGSKWSQIKVVIRRGGKKKSLFTLRVYTDIVVQFKSCKYLVFQFKIKERLYHNYTYTGGWFTKHSSVLRHRRFLLLCTIYVFWKSLSCYQCLGFRWLVRFSLSYCNY